MADINPPEHDEDDDSDASSTNSGDNNHHKQEQSIFQPVPGGPTGPHVIPHAAPLNQPGVRQALVQQGETVPGKEIDADEDLLADYDTDCEEVDLIHARISQISKLGLGKLTKLQRLCLRQNAIEVMALPESLAATLTDLDLYDNLLKRIEGLEEFTKLTSLDLSFNKIKHIKGVKQLSELKDLYFVQNLISKIENLEGLVKLRNLELGGNRIREIDGLDTLAGLEELWLGKNKITELKVCISFKL